MKWFIVLAAVLAVCFAAVPKNDRVVDHKLSDKEPGSPDYDHEAFLGKEQADEFNQLSLEESTRRLGIIVDKIDKNSDGQITEKELEEWIQFTKTHYYENDADKQFDTFDSNNDGKIHWDEYKNVSYGFMDDNDEGNDEDSEAYSYQKFIERDLRKWKKADTDNDNHCSMKEFRAFLHPEEYEHMMDVVVQETLDDLDKNKDGFVALQEYLGDLHDQEDGEAPDWLATEKEHFIKFKDQNGDEKLDFEEVKKWIAPDENHVKVEAKHLMSSSDENKDGVLTKEEILGKHDLFVGSQATNFGEILNRHDEF